MNYCFDEPLYDSEDDRDLEKANSLTVAENLNDMEKQALAQRLQEQDGSDEEMDEETA